MRVFVSGHLDLTPEEFAQHYIRRLRQAVSAGHSFVVGDARGADTFAQAWLSKCSDQVTVFHMLGKPRVSYGFPLCGGFTSDEERDAAMTAASDIDIAWVRPGRERSGTAKNLARRK